MHALSRVGGQPRLGPEGREGARHTAGPCTHFPATLTGPGTVWAGTCDVSCRAHGTRVALSQDWGCQRHFFLSFFFPASCLQMIGFDAPGAEHTLRVVFCWAAHLPGP